jgi:hypothetical protein
VSQPGDLRKNVSRMKRTDRNRDPADGGAMCSAAGTIMGTLLASGARDSLCTTEPTFSAELSTMLLRLASVGPLRSIMDNVGNGIRRGPAFEVLFSAFFDRFVSGSNPIKMDDG